VCADRLRERALGDRSDDAVGVRDLHRADIPAAVDVIARGMRDNPLHVAAYGPDPHRRQSCHAHVIRAILDVATTLDLLGVVRQGVLVGVLGAAPAGRCRPGPWQRLRLLPRIARLGPATGARILRWSGEWARHDPGEPHVHLGPVAVDAPLQGQGLGTLAMREHCRRLDESAQVGYLETDEWENVAFYRRFGYEVVGEAVVIGTENWFMRRPRGQPAS
jgi:ribosomal protein S18 acetylase RimI-like enzyme